MDGVPPNDRPVRLGQLWSAIDSTSRIVVRVEPLADSPVIYDSTRREDRVALRDALVLEPPEDWRHCMYMGTPAIYLETAVDRVVVLTNHHGHAVRCSLWDSDVPIVDLERWLRWFDERGMPGPRAEVDAQRAAAARAEANYRRWKAAMPPGVPAVWDEAAGTFAVDVAFHD